MTAVLMPTEASTAAMTVVGTLMTGVLRRKRFAARPQTSRHTPPPMAMIGSLRLRPKPQVLTALMHGTREHKPNISEGHLPVNTDQCAPVQTECVELLSNLENQVEALIWLRGRERQNLCDHAMMRQILRRDSNASAPVRPDHTACDTRRRADQRECPG